MTRKHLFISYPRTEIPFVQLLKSDLENEGFFLWIDQSDNGIPLGSEWVNTISDAIDKSFAVISVFCPRYIESKWCMGEMRTAYHRNIPIFPIQIKPVDIRSIPFEINTVQRLDMEKWLEPKAYRRQRDTLIQQLRRSYSEHIGIPPSIEGKYLNKLITELEFSQTGNLYIEQALERQHEFRLQPQLLPERPYVVEQTIELDPDLPEEVRTQHLTVEYRNAHELVQALDRFVILGDAGSGKSTMLKRIALESALARRKDPQTGLLPVLINFADWRDQAPTVEGFVRTHLPTNLTEKRGDLLLCFDGLNELGEDAPQRVVELRSWLASSDAPKHVIITCRRAEYSEELDLRFSAVVQLGMLDDTEVKLFAQHYLGNRTNSFIEQVYNDTLDSSVRQLLIELVRNPLTLTMLVYLYENAPEQSFPLTSSRVFAQMSTLLLEREFTRGNLGKAKPADIQAGLARLAFAMINDASGREFSIDQAMSRMHRLNGRPLLDAALEVNLLEIRGTTVRFYHPSMRDYFAALEVDRRSIPEKLSTPQLDTFGRRVQNKWDNAIVALCGITDQPSEFTEQVAKRDVFLALRCAFSGANVLPDIQDRLLNRLLNPSAGGKTLDADIKIVFNSGQKKQNKLMLYWRTLEDTLTEVGTAIAPYLIRRLYVANYSTQARLIMIRVLGKTRSTIASTHLINLVEKPTITDEEKTAALNALYEIADPKVVPQLCDLLQTRWVILAALALAKIGDSRAVQPIGKALLRLEYGVEVRIALARVLSSFAHVDAVPAFTIILRDRKGSSRKLGETVNAVLPQIGTTVMWGLFTLGTGALMIRQLQSGSSGTSNVSTAFNRIFKQFDDKLTNLGKAMGSLEDLRRVALEGLIAIRDRTAITGLIIALLDTDPRIRSRASNELEQRQWSRYTATPEEIAYYHASRGDWVSVLDTPEVGERIFLQLTEDAEKKNRQSLEAFYTQWKQKRFPTNTVVEPSERSDTAGVPALPEIATPTVYASSPEIEDTAGALPISSNETVVVQTTGGKITLSVDVDDIKGRLQDVSSAALTSLRGIGIRVGNNDEDKARQITALASVASLEARMHLIEFTKDPSETVRVAAVSALTSYSDETVDEALINLLRDPSSSVRKAASRVLGEHQSEKAVVPLIMLLNDKSGTSRFTLVRKQASERVCDVAAEALRRIGTPQAIQAVQAWQNT